MTITIISAIKCLQESKQKLKEENEKNIIINAKVLSKAKQAPPA